LRTRVVIPALDPGTIACWTAPVLLLAALGVAGMRAHRAEWHSTPLNVIDGLNRIFCRRVHRLQADPVALPATGGALVVANHVSGLDPLLLAAACARPMRFVIAREQYDRRWLRGLFRAMRLIPVERNGNPERALYAARRALEAGEVVALFPQGRIHLDHEPVRFKRGVTLLAATTGVPVYPVRIDGVRGAGHVVAALFMPGRARLRSFPPLQCTRNDAGARLRELEKLLSPGAP